ncbi:transposase [Sinorhizobium sp. 8-89]|uniref:transposase n=1 Tax=Sinorhizobium sp. 7-81 TaxID=3049087 RepID=UPI0024C311AB|nr:transposase [Sinorhizobium sp. 7-81]MDK1389673.1 transposase [Sinorhizobium sp. 7-81]
MSRLLDFPEDMYKLVHDEIAIFGHDPDIKRCVEHLKAAMSHEEWFKRRDQTAKRFYRSLIGEQPDPTGAGKFYDETDLFAWYLFLGEAFNDHPQNYEVVDGCRVMPIFSAPGRNLDHLQQIEGYEERLRRLIFKERAQPNGGLFEFLVAAAYVREGYAVAFHPEEPGRARTHDLDVARGNKRFAVECKRMEGGQYHENERKLMRGLWQPASHALLRTGGSYCFDLTFTTAIEELPDDYLFRLATDFVRRKIENQIVYDDLALGTLRMLDLAPLKAALAESSWMHPGPKYNNFLLGSYPRYESLLLAHKVRFSPNPPFIDEVDQAVALRWVSGCDVAIGKKARDVIASLQKRTSSYQTIRLASFTSVLKRSAATPSSSAGSKRSRPAFPTSIPKASRSAMFSVTTSRPRRRLRKLGQLARQRTTIRSGQARFHLTTSFLSPRTDFNAIRCALGKGWRRVVTLRLSAVRSKPICRQRQSKPVQHSRVHDLGTAHH